MVLIIKDLARIDATMSRLPIPTSHQKIHLLLMAAAMMEHRWEFSTGDTFRVGIKFLSIKILAWVALVQLHSRHYYDIMTKMANTGIIR